MDSHALRGFTPELSVVILCYRTGEFIRTLVSQMEQVLEKRGIRYELVLVANYDAKGHPPDESQWITSELSRRNKVVKVVARPKQGKMGWDLRSGLEAATGQVVAFLDGDGQIPAEDVVAVYDKLREGRYDMVKAYRKKRLDGIHRRGISWFYNVVLKLLFPAVHVQDANAKPKAISRQALRAMTLTSDGWFIDAEMVILASRLGFRIGEIPTVFYRNEYRKSFIGVREIHEFFMEMLRYRLRTLRDRKKPCVASEVSSTLLVSR